MKEEVTLVGFLLFFALVILLIVGFLFAGASVMRRWNQGSWLPFKVVRTPPVFCGTCGTKLELKLPIERFDYRSGEPVGKAYLLCPQRASNPGYLRFEHVRWTKRGGFWWVRN